jgi:hypothetical protein
MLSALTRTRVKRRREMTKTGDLPKLTAEQRKMVDQLSEENLRQIDQALLSNASTQWARTDRIVLATMIELDNGMGLPTLYFVQRIEQLVQQGLLETKGDLTRTKTS